MIGKLARNENSRVGEIPSTANINRSDAVPENHDATHWDQPSAGAGGSPLGEAQPPPKSDGLQETVQGASADAAPEALPIPSGSSAGDTKVFGEYELVDEIARGGMGVVYRARQTKLNRTVALKMILAGELASSSDVRRFYTEAEAAASLQHPGIVPIFDIGEVSGQHYFSMRYIEGKSLAAAVRDGPLPARNAAHYCEQIADAIAYAHQQGIIHRDLKPSNVLLDESGQPHVTDFGLAKMLQVDSDLTGTGQVVGTPSYMPPEQASGRIHDVGPTSDVYSLGAILYFLLTARPPFQASNLMETLKQVVEQEPVSPRQLNPGVPPDLETVCLKCLEKPQTRRYAGARELADELRRFLNDEPILARPVTRAARAWRWCRRNPGISALLLAIAASLLCGIGFSTYFAIQADVQLKEALKNERAATKAQAAAQTEAENAAASAAQAKRERDAAEEAKKKAENLRELARRQLEQSAPRAYLGDVRRAQLEWPRLNTVQRLAILQAYDPSRAASSTQRDPRAWEWYYLRGLCESNEHTLRGHASYVDKIEWSADGKWLASASSDNRLKEDAIRIWNAETGKLYRPLRGHKAAARAIAWQPAGNRLATGHDNGDLMIWDIRSGKALATLNQAKAPVTALCYSPGGDTLAISAGDAVSLLESATGEFRSSLVGHARAVRRLKWNASGKLLATSAVFDSVRIWDVDRRTAARIIEQRASEAQSESPAIAWHRDGKTFACETARTRVTVFDLANPASPQRDYASDALGSAELQFSPDGRYLAAIGPERASVWEWRSGAKPVATTPGTIGGWLPGSARLLLATPQNPGRAQIFDVAQADAIGVFDGHIADIYALSAAPGGGRFASAGADRSVRLWTLEGPARSRPIEPPLAAKTWLAELSEGGQALAACSWDRSQIFVFDGLTGKRVKTLQLSDQDGLVASLAWSPDAAILASSSLVPGDETRGRLILWDVKSGTQLRSIGGPAALQNPKFSPDGSKLAVPTEIFSVRTAARLSRLPSGGAVVAWSPDGTQIVTTSGIVCDTATGKPVGTVGLQCQPPLAWSADGKWIAGARFDESLQAGSLCLWNRETKSLTVSSPIRSRIATIRWSPDSARVLTSTLEEVSVWDPSAAEMPALTFPETDVSSLLASSEPIIDAHWSARGEAIRWATLAAIQTRDAAPGYRRSDTPTGGVLFAGANAGPAISLRPAPAAPFVRTWHFSPQSKPWLDRDNFVKLESGELDSLQKTALAAPAVVSESAFVDVLPHLERDRQNVAGYAVCRFTSEADQMLRLYTGSDDAMRIWLDGKLVRQVLLLRPAQPDQETSEVQVRAGEHTLVVEISNALGDCGFYLRLEQTDGTPAVIDSQGRIVTHRESSINR
jgi:serine/threonine protein kinase/WD40 repeat protein